MRIVKLMFSVLIAFSLLTGNIASAAMTCCAKNNASITKEMPCHHSADKNSNHQIDNCKICKTCLNISTLSSQLAPITYAFTGIRYVLPSSSFTSFNPRGIDSPPKYFS